MIFAVAFAAFRLSPRGQHHDSRYALLVSHQLVNHGVLHLDPFAPPAAGGGPDAPLPEHFVRAGGHVHYFFPVGSSILAAPYVLAAQLLGRRPVDAEGRYHRRAERALQRTLAALAMAGLACLFFATARQLLPVRTSLQVAAAGAFGTSIWSTASRSLWSHTFLVLLLGGAIHLLVRDARAARRGEGPGAPGAALLATLLAWACLVRPTAAVSVLAVAGYLAAVRRAALVPFAAAGLLWAAVFAALFQATTDSPLPPYYRPARLGFDAFPTALAGNLVSPARGLLVYSPIVLFAAYLVISRWRSLPLRGLAVVAAACVVLQLVVVSGYSPWWGGYAYGARFMTDAVPWLVLLGILGLAAAPLGLARRERAAAAVLLALSVALNATGAISRSAARWNQTQEVPGFDAKLWDWRDPPFLRWAKAQERAGG